METRRMPCDSNLKPCSQDEIDAYFQFASLPLQERRRRVFLKMIETMPDSPFVHDLLSGRIEMPKRRGRQPKPRSLSKSKPKTLKAKAPTKAALPYTPNPYIEFDD
jgi:hypothetical protein